MRAPPHLHGADRVALGLDGGTASFRCGALVVGDADADLHQYADRVRDREPRTVILGERAHPARQRRRHLVGQGRLGLVEPGALADTAGGVCLPCLVEERGCEVGSRPRPLTLRIPATTTNHQLRPRFPWGKLLPPLALSRSWKTPGSTPRRCFAAT